MVKKVPCWCDSEAEARDVARGSGYLLWRVTKYIRERRGIHWGMRYPSGPVRYYVGFEVPRSYRRSHKVADPTR